MIDLDRFIIGFDRTLRTLLRTGDVSTAYAGRGSRPSRMMPRPESTRPR